MKEKRLFIASCLALVATSMAFSIRADIIPALKTDFGFNDTEMGLIAGPGLWGFAITIVLGGMLLDAVGMKALMIAAFVGHVAGVILTIFAQGYQSLYFATLLIGLANGTVEAVTNPLVATIYPKEKTRALNMLHAWWPGGLIAGGVGVLIITQVMGLGVGASLGAISLGWKVKMALILVPTLLYGVLILKQEFPVTERVAAGVSTAQMWATVTRPLFLLFVFLMMLTSATELGPDQWVGNLLQNLVGIQGVVLLVYTAGIMFILRYFLAGYIVKSVGPMGVLMGASILTCIGLYALSMADTALWVFAAATIFGFGKTFFWPTMLGVVAERFPKGGALALSFMGGAGMFCVGWLMTPIMGSIQDHYAVQSLSPRAAESVVAHGGIDERKAALVTDAVVKAEIEQAKRYSAEMTYRWVAAVPAFLAFVFLMLLFYFRSLGGYRPVSVVATVEPSGTQPRFSV